MHDFKIRSGRLHCERVPVEAIARAAGTPVYIYSRHTIVDHYQKLARAFRALKPLICFSVKANGNLAILKLLVSQGAGLDIVSGGELFRARAAGCPGNRIVFASVGKRPDEIRQALSERIACFNVESIAELAAINAEAGCLGRKAQVALRINPDVEAHTHHYITTGVATSKFGINLELAEREILTRWRRYPHLELQGFHLHIGSQITQAAPFIKAIAKVGGLITRLRARGVRIETLNLGGGLGIVYKDEAPQTADAFARKVVPQIAKLGVRLILEPGRFIVGNAGALIAQVLYLKESRGKRFIVVDTGMNDLIRPALYSAYHEILPVAKTAGRPKVYDVVGPVCESADVLGSARSLPEPTPGAYLAVLGAGAYGFVMSSNYNGRGRAAEVMVKGSKWFIVRKRETVEDLVRLETMPKALVS